MTEDRDQRTEHEMLRDRIIELDKERARLMGIWREMDPVTGEVEKE